MPAHWADAIPIPARLDLKTGGPLRPCAACGNQITEYWGHIFYDCPALLEGDPEDEYNLLPDQLSEIRGRLVQLGLALGQPA